MDQSFKQVFKLKYALQENMWSGYLSYVYIGIDESNCDSNRAFLDDLLHLLVLGVVSWENIL